MIPTLRKLTFKKVPCSACLGIIFEEQDKFPDALECYNRALALKPGFWQLKQRKGKRALSLAVCLVRLNELDAAL